MPVSSTVEISQWLARRRPISAGTVESGSNGEQPLRADLFSTEQLERHASVLAQRHKIDPVQGSDLLRRRLSSNRSVLLSTYKLIDAAAKARRPTTPASEWLLDNYYLIEDQIQMARRDLPYRYSRELPRLAEGPGAGYPRIYNVVLELIAHSDGRIDMDSLARFIAAYQAAAPLKIGELWAVPIMLRLALIENLRRVAGRITKSHRARDRASYWAERLLDTADKQPTHIVLVLADMVREGPTLSGPFVAEFVRRLHGQNPFMTFPLSWVEQRLAEQGETVEQLIQQESQNQAADQVSMAHSIGSLRMLAGVEWREFVEELSQIEQTLREDPSGDYPRMDFATRDLYRHAVERIARGSKLTENQVAERAVALARDNRNAALSERRRHVGYYLVGMGRRELERDVHMRVGPKVFAARLLQRAPLLWFLSGIAILTAVPTWAALAWFQHHGAASWTLGLLAIPLLLAASQVAITFVNWLVGKLVPPRPIPKLDFKEGIPPQYRTMVVVPTMLNSAAGVEAALQRLELRYIANRDPHLCFALLTDFSDASQQHMPDDDALLRQAREGIETLENRYGDGHMGTFFFFHRPRRWNEQQGIWMGWERKRGKLQDLNGLLRGESAENFSAVVGRVEILSNIKYVITLDADTLLPRDSAQKLVGAMAHPLNRPRVDPRLLRVVEGYGVMQPRVGVDLPSAGRSWYSRLFASSPGIDPYTQMVSDVYQDAFAEGSFIGKGIYDVDVFKEVLHQRFPTNRILSHDLLEGSYIRSGLVSDVLFFEDYPSSYLVDACRRHRWIRGDWQIASWLRRRVPGPTGRAQPNPISGLSRWKIFDNLRRSLVPPALMLLLLISWFIAGAPILGLVMVLSVLAVPTATSLLSELSHEPLRMLRSLGERKAAFTISRQLGAILLQFVSLPYEAYLSLDAVIRTLLRLSVTRCRLLEWQTHHDAERSLRGDLIGAYRTMWFAPVAGLVIAAGMTIWRPHASMWVVLPVVGLWLLAPCIVWLLSRPIRHRRSLLTADDRVFLREVSRRTWRFFEHFVVEEDHWLPPDNYQEKPAEACAHRTSPTNIGLSLLANLGAHDFGYLSTTGLLDRTNKTLTVMEGLERHRGHFYNWYNTQTLETLPPIYVSTVDSGNLAGALLILSRGMLELKDSPIISARALDGLLDTLRIARKQADSVGEGDDPAAIELQQSLTQIAGRLQQWPSTLRGVYQLFQDTSAALDDLTVQIDAVTDEETQWWARAAQQQCAGFRDELAGLAPWVLLPAPDEVASQHADAELFAKLDRVPRLSELARLNDDLWAAMDSENAGQQSPTLAAGGPAWAARLRSACADAQQQAAARMEELDELAARCAKLADFDYELLYNRSNRLMSIGYDVSHRRLDPNYYDLLASEARLASYVGIAQGKLPEEHWFALSRLMVNANGEPALVSWSGSMFEYLMPLTIMPSYEGALLDQTCRAVVNQQIAYARRRGVPWGISESAFYATDSALNYQYRAFGVPEVGLKRGLADDLVIAPYACALALTVEPAASCANLRRLAREDRLGRFGFYEAIDYTLARMPRGQTSALVSSFMAHHQGMSLLSLAAVLLDRPMHRRFEADPELKTCELLLQERVPRVRSVFAPPPGMAVLPGLIDESQSSTRVFGSPHTPAPEVHLLSNGQYHRMVTVAGGGYCLWRDLAVTRWREDSTRDCWGQFCYVRDVATQRFWSSAYQPTHKHPSSFEAVFSQANVEFRRRDEDIETRTEYSVSPEDDVDLRRIHLTNHGRRPRLIELTSYAEVALLPPAAEASHPAFSNLFVQAEVLRDRQAILCTRRPRSASEHTPWMMHLMVVHADARGQASYETDRSRFIGRGRTLQDPQAMHVPQLSNSEGAPLDPIVAIRQVISLQPDETAVIDIVTGVAETRDGAQNLVDKYRDRRLVDRAFELAWVHSQVILRQLDATEADAQLYGRLAGAVLFAQTGCRAPGALIARNRSGQSALWRYGISGDIPIVLLRMRDSGNIDLVRRLIQAHAYWRLKGLAVDLVIWNEEQTSYQQNLHDRITGLLAGSMEAHLVDRPGGIFVRRTDQILEEDQTLMQAVARIVLTDSAGTLSEQLKRHSRPEGRVPRFAPRVGHDEDTPPPPMKLPARQRECFNGWGGFTPDGREYVIDIQDMKVPPAPWANVIANPKLGTVVTESGGAYTWFENAHEYRLTPWNSDAVTDLSGEAFYIRDEATGKYWSPTPLPATGRQPYVTRHGFGYSVFEHQEEGIETEMWTYVAVDAPVKFVLLKFRNPSDQQRRLSVTGYVEWVLGEHRTRNLMHIITEVDPQSHALLARNAYNDSAPGWIAFLNCTEAQRTVTGDRAEVLGRNGTPTHPAMMGKVRLSGRTGAGLDPCGAMQTAVDLAPRQEREICFVLGAGHNLDEVRELAQRFANVEAARAARQHAWDYWNRTLGTVYVETPDPTLNFLANGWLLYQTLSARYFGRSGYYQSGGAFGYRDQLQDLMALVHAAPELLRNHLLVSAAHQFVEGDVQHWWHPPSNRGVRTRISDDYLWLPLATARYMAATGDVGVLDETVHYLEGRPLRPEEEAYYDLPATSSRAATLYEHCTAAIEHGLRFGERGLPLMGAGDWNDGMNLVGKGGTGESVWLGFFLYHVLMTFIPVCRQRGDEALADRYAAQAATLRDRIEQHAWDGEWYTRAYFDDGQPLGSASNDECKIDSLPQSWSVISGAGNPDRARTALDSVYARLVRRDGGLIQLFDPPFDKTTLDPGYIRGYLPGIRENGGQYTHAAVWTIMAFAALNDAKRAWELFNLINPIRHGDTRQAASKYRVEPYVVAADIYANPQHLGRGGWTWYTGSAGWMYRLLTESFLGLRLEVDRLRIEPCLPREWQTFKIHYRFRETFYHITVIRDEANSKMVLDGEEHNELVIPLVDDRRDHHVELRIAPEQESAG